MPESHNEMEPFTHDELRRSWDSVEPTIDFERIEINEFDRDWEQSEYYLQLAAAPTTSFPNLLTFWIATLKTLLGHDARWMSDYQENAWHRAIAPAELADMVDEWASHLIHREQLRAPSNVIGAVHVRFMLADQALIAETQSGYWAAYLSSSA